MKFMVALKKVSERKKTGITLVVSGIIQTVLWSLGVA
jgi:hypothetical protein